MMKIKILQRVGLLFVCGLLLSCGGSSSSGGANTNSTPNILFVIMDDVGIDQMELFGYGGLNPPQMPNMAVVANAGVRFRNTWSMPECSPGRASAFVGRYPFRTNIPGAIGQNDLANSQLSTYDMTTPKLLKNANYESAMFGKFHIAGPDNYPDGYGAPAALGWDYFYGWVDGLPGSIDTTAGGASTLTGQSYQCGYVPGPAFSNGAGTGACYQSNNSCSVVSIVSAGGDAPGKFCAARGGIFVPNQSCQSTAPAGLNFNQQNAFYVSPLVINQGSVVTQVPLTDPRSRGYRTTIETNAAIGWINGRAASKPWMATVSFSAAHTPLQQSPARLAPSSLSTVETVNCQSMSLPTQQILQNQITEAMDTEFGRLMLETGLATRGADGSLKYDPKATNTMIVIVGDNGTLGSSAKVPFNPQRAKGTAYQTGVWVPLIVAGPLVTQPNREVNHMVNMVDVFQLFGEIAGLDVPSLVPRVIDSAPLMPYIANANQSSIRSVNFTMGSYNIQANGGRNGPCIISGSSCSQVPIKKSVCEDNGGVWWGSGYSESDASIIPNGGTGYKSCCEVNQAKYLSGGASALISIVPETTYGVRNENYKIVQNITQYYDETNNRCIDPATQKQLTTTVTELFEINQATPSPTLDNTALNYSGSSTLTAIYNDLYSKLTSILASQPACPGDANIDGVVNSQDLSIWQRLLSWALSSIADFNWDGLTNNVDGQIIQSNTGTCPKASSTY